MRRPSERVGAQVQVPCNAMLDPSSARAPDMAARREPSALAPHRKLAAAAAVFLVLILLIRGERKAGGDLFRA